MAERVTKMRTLQKAGFVHVAGWLRVDDAAPVMEKIEAAKSKVAEALTNDRN